MERKTQLRHLATLQETGYGSWMDVEQSGCPSQKLIRGKFVEKTFSSMQRLNKIPNVKFIRKDGFNVKSLIDVDSGHRSAKTVRCF